MKSTPRLSYTTILQRSAVAIAAAVACASASAALPDFTFDPAAVGLAGTSFTGNNILISDFSTVLGGFGGGDFTDSGFLSVSAFQNSAGATFIPTGLNSAYGLYIAFEGAGTGAAFTSLSYTLYGYNGAATFGVDPVTHVPFETATGEVALAHGSLISGGVGQTNGSPSANADLTFVVDMPGFFAAPSPTFYNMAITAFINTTSQVQAFDGGFSIVQGGGSINFAMAPAIPEPETYALLLGGLAAVGFVARRRRT